MQALQCRQHAQTACGGGQQQRAIACRAATVAPRAHLRAPHALPITPQSSSTPVRLPHTVARAQAQEKVDQLETHSNSSQLVGEDAASFDFSKQSLQSWGIFVALLSTVLGAMYLVWIRPGGGLAEDYLQLVESFTSNNTEATIVALLAIFAAFHSGLAGLRPKGEELIGARAYRVMFALISLPLAVTTVVYFINHRYSGTPLWNLQAVPGMHTFVWVLSFVSFFFLYPSTFNILEVAAVDKPKLHLWETGIMRVTRHPQAFGQALWCLAHTLWVGNSFMVATSLGLMAHHAFGCWHGDRRLADKYGEAFEKVKARTSTVPFAAILDGRQKLPDDYWKEFARWPYVAVTCFTLGAYICHPLMQQASYSLHW